MLYILAWQYVIYPCMALYAIWPLCILSVLMGTEITSSSNTGVSFTGLMPTITMQRFIILKIQLPVLHSHNWCVYSEKISYCDIIL